MYKILSKYNFITILPFEETFFHVSSLVKNIKFSQELLRLNYLKYAPYKNPNILSILQNNQLLLWFYKTNADTSIVIPESYLLFRELKNRNTDAVYVIHDQNIKILVVKNSQLLSTFSSDYMDDITINLTMDEYQVPNRVDIEKTEYEEIKQSSLDALTLKELYLFNKLDLDKKTLFKKLIDRASYPIAALVMFAVFVSYIQGNILQSDIDGLKQTYNEKKSENKEIKKFIKEHNSEVNKWEGFIKKELADIEPIKLLNSIYTIFKEDEKALLLDVSISGNKMLIKIQTDVNPVVFLNRLNEVKYFSRVIIQNTHKPRNEMKIISYDLDVKMLKDI